MARKNWKKWSVTLQWPKLAGGGFSTTYEWDGGKGPHSEPEHIRHIVGKWLREALADAMELPSK